MLTTLVCREWNMVRGDHTPTRFSLDWFSIVLLHSTNNSVLALNTVYSLTRYLGMEREVCPQNIQHFSKNTCR